MRRKIHASLLAALIALQPLPAVAGGITPATSSVHQPALTTAGNGVPIVNIVAPNAVGVSHNRYDSFSVGPQGAILNNAQALTLTGLGGYVEANPNLGTGSARLILNEVTGSTRSFLEGYLEVAGPAADVVVANPYGISCKGCGFINTGRATLSTGTPTFAAGGDLAGYQVTGGDILIHGDGLNAGNVDSLGLLARALDLRAAVYAQDLAVHTGAGNYDVAGNWLAAATAGPAPVVAIDSSALGGIYANRIRMIANEAGIGVRLAAPVAAQTGDLLIDVNGALSYRRLSAADAVQLQAAGITGTGNLTAGSRAQLQADSIHLEQGFVAAANVDLVAADVTIGAAAGIYADTPAGDGQAQIRVDTLRNAGLIQGNTVALTASTGLHNAGNPEQDDAGTVVADRLQLAAPVFSNDGGVVATRAGTGDTFNEVLLGLLDNRNGILALAGDQETLAVALDNRAGVLRHDSTGSIRIMPIGTLHNEGGVLVSAGSLQLRADALVTDADSIIAADQLLHLWLPEIHAIPDGLVAAGAVLHLQSDGDLAFADVTYAADSSLWLTAAGAVTIDHAVVGAAGDLDIQAGRLMVAADAVLYADRNLLVDVDGDLVNRGLLYATDNLQVTGSARILNGDETAAASIVAGNNILLTADTAIINTGSVIEAINGSVQLGSADAPVPLIENRRTGLVVTENSAQVIGWSTTDRGNESYDFPNDPWWLAHCFEFFGHCGNPLQVDAAVASENAAREQENLLRAAQGLPLLALVDYRQFDPADRPGAAAYLEAELGSGGWLGSKNHENRRFIRNTDDLVWEEIASAGRGSQIVAGSDVSLRGGSILNKDSVISAAGDVLITADSSFTNRATTLTATTERAWWMRYYECHSSGGGTDCDNHSGVPPDHPASETLAPVYSQVPSLVEAGGTVLINGGVIANTGTADVTGWQPSGLFAGPPAPDVPVDVGAIGHAVSAGLPSGPGLFQLNSTPGHPYLIETHPALTQYNQFIGSDYLLARLGLDPAAVTRRLGDAFYEMKLLREALLAQAGSRFVGDYASEQEQYLALLENGVYAAESMQLSLGVSLSAAQINALTADMVWLEQREIAGYTVLVPVLYLVPGSASLTTSGALIAGHTVVVAGTDIDNRGTIHGRHTVALDAANRLLNENGVLASGGALGAVAGGDLINRGGLIAATGDAVLVSGGNLVQETLSETRTQEFVGGSSHDTYLGANA